VNGRLRLIQLIPEAKQAFYEDKLTVAHAFEIARLQPNDQRCALQECFPQYRNAAAILKDKKAEATTVRELRAWIEREIHLDLTNAPFDPQDETLLPKAGACARCPKRTGSNPLLFPEVRQKSTCMLSGIVLARGSSSMREVRFAEARLCASLASPGTKACDGARSDALYGAG
jgi:hypothetical protein